MTTTLCTCVLTTAAAWAAQEPTAEQLERFGIRRLESKHLTLYTDLPSSPAVDRLPTEFDQAYPQWCEYFGLAQAQSPVWHVTACLMRNRERFEESGLLPPEVPDFEHGYTLGDRCWLNEQPSDYYRRHLLLHEGTHAFMLTRMRHCGPTWYMEGIAELLATHRLDGDRLRMHYFPKHRDEVPYWGRIKLIAEGLAGGNQLELTRLLPIQPREFPDRLGYAWGWAAASFLDGHPRYRERFRQLSKFVTEPDFNRRAEKIFGDDWPAVCAEFALFLHDLEYGYDLERTALDWAPGTPLAADGQTVTIRADRGWQNTGIALAAGKRYELRAEGRYVVANEPPEWISEPGGVTIRYYRGRPLGELQAVVVPPAAEAAQHFPWNDAVPIGLGRWIEPGASGTLFLRINDSAAELADNQGQVQVTVKPAKTRTAEAAETSAN